MGTDNAVKESIKEVSSSTKWKPRVLDLGCGPIQYQRKYFETVGCEYLGMDIVGSAPIIHWDGIQIPLANRSIDYVLISWTLQNILNVNQVLEEAHRVLKKKGILFIVNTELSPISLSTGEDSTQNALEKSRLLPEGMRILLASNFEKIRIERLGGIGHILGWNLHFIWQKCYKNRKPTIRMISLMCFPLFVILTLLTNLTGLLYSFFDNTGKFFPFFTVTAQKRN